MGSALGIASRDHDLRAWILALDAANGSARILVRSIGDRTRIQNDQVGLAGGRGTGQAALSQLTLQGGAIRLSGAAAEVFYVVTGHLSMVAHGAVGRGRTRVPQRGHNKAGGSELSTNFGELSPNFGELQRASATPQLRACSDQAVAVVRRCWKHSRQKTGRPCVGRKGTVVSLPHCEQVARVSTLV